MSDIDNKVVSISFNNKQFLKDVQDTITVIEELNEATSGKHINTSGIENLGRAFRSTTSELTRDASSVTSALNNIQSAANINFQTGGIDSLRKALENTGMAAVDVEDTITSLQQLSRTGVSYAGDLGVSNTAQQIQNASNDTRSIITQDIDDVSHQFSALEMIGVGAMIAIGEKAAEIGANALRSLTAGIRSGWGEYNALTNSTQTILVNTQRWGSTMSDVSSALEELNRYADMTTYSFSDMTRNIGYFTTAGVNLEDSITAIQGLSNVGAMFGADAQAVARAGYQISQAMSAGVIRLMDWRSMINAGMGGQALQDELIRTAAVMSGTSIDAMNEYIDSLGGFNASLQEGWLTSDIFLEAMKTFAGQSREYYESLTDENGNRLYDDETIDRLVEMGESAMESATKVRTLQQMMDAFSESIGSGWQRTFTLIIGNLEEAKEFWSPINNILTSMVDGFFSLQTGALEAWRALGGREELIQGILNVLNGLNGVLSAIGGAFIDVFGSSHIIGNRLFRITEALTDFTETLILSEDELQDLRDFFGGILEPMGLIVDIIFELVQAFFNAGDAMNEFSEGTDSVMDGTRSFREALLLVLGSFGRILKAGAKFIRENNAVKKVIQTFAKAVKIAFTTVARVIAAPFILFYNIWQRYNIGEKLEEFWMKVVEFFLPIIDAVEEVKNVFVDWFYTLKSNFDNLDFDGIDVIVEIFGALKQLFRDIIDPTVSLSDAFGTFIDTLSGGHTGELLNSIKESVANLWDQLKNTAIGQWFSDLGEKIQNGAAAFARTSFGQKIIEISSALRDFLGIDITDWGLFWEATKLMLTDVADSIGTGWEKIKNFFNELVSIVKGWFGFADSEDGSVGESVDSMIGTTDSSVMEDKIDTMEKTGNAVVSFMENTSKAVAIAEKLVPDPNESKFLTFMKELPEKIKDVSESVSDSSIIAKIGNFFSNFFTSIKNFFSNLSIGDGEDLLTWLADKARVIGNIIGDFLGIKITNLADQGVFGVLGAMVSAIVGWFGDIDLNLLGTVDRIAKTVYRVLTAIISLKIVSTISYLANAAQAGAKGWQQQQAAKKLSALSDVLKSITLFIVGIGAVVFSLAYALDNDYIKPGTLKQIAGTIALFMFALWLMVFTIEKSAKNIKPGSLTGIAKVLSNMGKMLIIVVLSVAALFGLAYLAYNIYMKAGIDITTFNVILGVVCSAFVAIMVGSMVMVYLLQRWGGRMNAGSEVMASISSVLKSVSGIFVSIIILLAGILASIAAFTYFINMVKQNHAESELKQALVVVGILLVGAGLAIVGLIAIAKKMSSGISGVKPSDFKQIMMVMSGLLVTVMASIVVLIMAVTAFVSMMTTTGATEDQIWTAAFIVGGLLLAVFGGLKWLFDSLKNISELHPGKMWSAFAAMILTMATLGTIVGVLVYEAANLSQSLNSVKNLWHVLGAMGATLLSIIIAVAGIGFIIEHSNFTAFSTKALITLGLTILEIMVAVVGITHSLKAIITALSSTGFLENGGNIMEVAGAMIAMLFVVSIIAGVVAAMSNLQMNVGGIVKIFLAFATVAATLWGIAKAISLLADIDTSKLIAAASAMGILMSVGVGLMAVLAVLGALVPGGYFAIGFAAIALVALSVSFLSLASAVKVTGEGLILITTALAGFTRAFNNLQNLNVEGVASKFFYILRVIKVLADGVKEIVPVFGAIIFEAVKSIMAGLTSGFAVGFGEGMLTIAEFIMTYGPVIVTAFTALGVMIANSIHTVLLYFMAQIVADFGPGGTVRTMIGTLSDFAMWLAGEAATWAVDIVAAFLESIALTLSDENKLARIVDAIRLLWLTAKKAFMDELGFPDLRALGSHIVLEVLRGIVGAITTIAEGTMSPALQAALAAAGIDVDSIVNDLNGTLQSASQLAANDVFNSATLTAEIDTLREHLNELGNATEEAYNGPSYDPTSYYRSISGAAQEATEATQQYADTTSTAATGLSSLLGGLNIGDALSNIDLSTITGLFSGSSGSGLLGGLSGISDILGGIDLSSISGIISQLGGGGGISSILSGIIGGGGATSLVSGLIGGEGFDLSGLLSGLMTDDVTNPVITPVINTDEYSLGLDIMEALWNSHNFDEFAIDAGTSMTLREQAEGDAATNGAVTYNFTQYNTSPEALSPIQIYRDTNNLLRGRVNS